MSHYDQMAREHRRRRYHRRPAVTESDSHERALRWRSCVYLQRLLTCHQSLGPEFLELLGVLLGPGVEPINRLILNCLEGSARDHFAEEFAECRFMPDRWPREALDALTRCDPRVEPELTHLIADLLVKQAKSWPAASAATSSGGRSNSRRCWP